MKNSDIQENAEYLHIPTNNRRVKVLHKLNQPAAQEYGDGDPFIDSDEERYLVQIEFVDTKEKAVVETQELAELPET